MTEPDDASGKSSPTELSGDPALGLIIRNARKDAGLSQERLAELVGGLSKAAISNWEKGTNKITDENRRQLHVVLKIPLHVLFKTEPPPTDRDLTEVEWGMVQKFRRLRDDRKEALLLILSSYEDRGGRHG